MYTVYTMDRVSVLRAWDAEDYVVLRHCRNTHSYIVYPLNNKNPDMSGDTGNRSGFFY